MVKIVDEIKRANEQATHYFGFEYVAPTTEGGLATFYDRIERMSTLDPLFCGITWGDFGRTAETSIEMASTCQSLLSLNCQVHLSGYTATPEEMWQWLSVLREKGVRNVLVTRGRAVGPAKDGQVHFPHAVDLVRFIRKGFGDYFGIAVVAFPESEAGLLDSQAAEQEMLYLKEKVNAGADYIITNCVFDAKVYTDFCHRCRSHGIRCPILCGVMPISHKRQLHFFQLAHLSGIAELKARVAQLDAAVAEATVTAGQPAPPPTPAAAAAAAPTEEEVRGIMQAFMYELVQSLFARGANGLYFFTMNVETQVTALVKNLRLTTQRSFPWKPSENEERRRKETVRPVHWSTRVTSYMMRTSQWKDFQSSETVTMSSHSHPQQGEDGAAGKAQQAGGGGELGSYHARLLLRCRAKRCVRFLALCNDGGGSVAQSLEELCRIFVQFLDGNGTLPWADELSGETQYMTERMLKPLNARGLFTINSQPHVNGAPSSNAVVGWGPKDGFIYQKSYVEFFCPPSHAATVHATLDRYPSLQYVAMNAKGQITKSNWRTEEQDAADGAGGQGGGCGGCPLLTSLAADKNSHPMRSSSSGIGSGLFGRGVTALTWGVFPNREIIQPTIVSVDTFHAWVGEAFNLWAAPFAAADVPPVIRFIQAEWQLFCIVDNAYTETHAPLEHAVAEVCSKIPPLIPLDPTNWMLKETITSSGSSNSHNNHTVSGNPALASMATTSTSATAAGAVSAPPKAASEAEELRAQQRQVLMRMAGIEIR